MDKTNKQEIQVEIYHIISKNPGIHLSKIAELMDMHISKVEQNLEYLEKNKIIIAMQDLGYKRYYVDKKGVGTRSASSIETRKKIYTLITKNPGIHLSGIASMLEMRISHIEYHLLQMEHNQSIISIKDEKGYYKRYYTEDSKLGIKNKKLLALLRQEIPSTIISLLLKNSHLQHKDLIKHFDIGPSTLSYHLQKLVKLGIIEVQTYGKDKGYSLKNKKEITDLLLNYELNLLTRDFKDVWKNLNR